eukprot:scaffold51411_cov57-Phaeocystis_antarctica.AAC.2
MPGGEGGGEGGGGDSGGTAATPVPTATFSFPFSSARIAVSQHSVTVPSGPTAVGTDVSPVDQEHRRIVPVLHDKVPVPVAAGVRRLEQDHCRGGVVKRGRVRPLQQEFAARVARRVLVGGRVPIDGADERGVADAVGPIECELSVHVERPGEATSAHDAVRRAVLCPIGSGVIAFV